MRRRCNAAVVLPWTNHRAGWIWGSLEVCCDDEGGNFQQPRQQHLGLSLLDHKLCCLGGLVCYPSEGLQLCFPWLSYSQSFCAELNLRLLLLPAGESEWEVSSSLHEHGYHDFHGNHSVRSNRRRCRAQDCCSLVIEKLNQACWCSLCGKIILQLTFS